MRKAFAMDGFFSFTSFLFPQARFCRGAQDLFSNPQDAVTDESFVREIKGCQRDIFAKMVLRN